MPASRQVLCIIMPQFQLFKCSIILFSCSGPGYIAFDITPIAQAWVTGNQNHGVMLRATNESIAGQSPIFVADEGPVAQRPYLDVVYQPSSMPCY